MAIEQRHLHAYQSEFDPRAHAKVEGENQLHQLGLTFASWHTCPHTYITYIGYQRDLLNIHILIVFERERLCVYMPWPACEEDNLWELVFSPSTMWVQEIKFRL